jgi:hypothetical protein
MTHVNEKAKVWTFWVKSEEHVMLQPKGSRVREVIRVSGGARNWVKSMQNAMASTGSKCEVWYCD